MTPSNAANSGEILVSSANPDSATQDTTLDVTINGSGFSAGAVATWSFQGVTDASQIRTNSTRYVTSRKLIANITISASAKVGKWDIAVAAGGKGGIGTEMFAVKTKPNVDDNSRANYVLLNSVNVASPGQPEDVRPAGMRGDGRLRDGTSAGLGDSEYQGAFCGVNGVIFNGNVNTGGASGDFNFAPDGNYGNYCGASRFFVLQLGSNLHQVKPATRISSIWSIPIGTGAGKAVQFSTGISGCQRLVFDAAYPPSANLQVTRLPDSTTSVGTVRRWTVESAGAHMATCLNQKSLKQWTVGSSYFVPLSMIVTEIPYPHPTFP